MCVRVCVYMESKKMLLMNLFAGQENWDDPEGWDGKGSGRGFRMGNTCTPMADSCQCMAKTTTVL